MAGAKLNWSVVNTTNLLGLKIVGLLVGGRHKIKSVSNKCLKRCLKPESSKPAIKSRFAGEV